MTDHCAPCLSHFTHIVDLDSPGELGAMMASTGLSRVLGDQDTRVNPTRGGASREAVTTFMDELECDEVEELAAIYWPDLLLFNFSMKSVLHSSMNCSVP